MAQLQKADMVAVLERTHLVVSDESFLLPLYESISNAIHAIQERWGDQSAEEGRIRAKAQTVLSPSNLSGPAEMIIRVEKQVLTRSNKCSIRPKKFERLETSALHLRR